MDQELIAQHHIKMFRAAHRMMFNLIKLERYTEAEAISLKLTGIIRLWDLQSKTSQSAAMKISRPFLKKK